MGSPSPWAAPACAWPTKPTRRFVGEGWSFTYPHDVAVSVADAVQVVNKGVMVRLHTLRGDSAEDEALDALTKFLAPHTPQASRRRIGAVEATGRKFPPINNVTFEMYAPKLSDELRLGVVVQTGCSDRTALSSTACSAASPWGTPTRCPCSMGTSTAVRWSCSSTGPPGSS